MGHSIKNGLFAFNPVQGQLLEVSLVVPIIAFRIFDASSEEKLEILIPHPDDIDDSTCAVTCANFRCTAGITLWDDEPQKLLLPPLVESLHEEGDAGLSHLAGNGDPSLFASVFICRNGGSIQRIYPTSESIENYASSLNCETIRLQQTSSIVDIRFFPTSISDGDELKIIGCSILDAEKQLFIYGLLRRSPLTVDIQSVCRCCSF